MNRTRASCPRSAPRIACRRYSHSIRIPSCAHRCARGMPLADLPLMSRTSRLRMAVIGQGHFAQVAVLPAIEQLDDVELSALVSGSHHKLDELGDRYGVRTLCEYDDLDDLLATGGIDAVYIAVPN